MHSPHERAGGSNGGGSIVGFDTALQMEMPRTTSNSGVETSSVHRHHPKHGESTNMRQPGAENNQIGSTTMNPISTESGSAAAGGGGGGGSQAEAAAAGQLQPPPSSSSSPDYDAQQPQQQRALEQLCFYRALFAEGAPDCCGGGDFPRPPGTTTGATVAAQAYYFMMRVAMVAALGWFLYFFIFGWKILRCTLWLPKITAVMACLAATFVLPSKFKAAADEIGAAAITTTPRPAAAEAAEAAVGTSPDDNDDDDDDDDESRRVRRRLLDLEGINWAGRRALIFTAAWLVLGVGVCWQCRGNVE